jgi:predicted O-methyltransferase YrrM
MISRTNVWANDEAFKKTFKDFMSIDGFDNSIEDPINERLYLLQQFAKRQTSLDSNFVEIGVYAGMSMFFMADYCTQSFIGIDSFEGVSEPTPGVDTDYFKKGLLACDKSTADRYLSRFNNIDLIKGWVPDILETLPDIKYSLVHIDVDLYQPTKECIEYFWDKLLPNGVLVCDDFGSSKTVGAKKAMVDFFGRDNIIEFSTQQAFVIKY